jgi:hypothetical protein
MATYLYGILLARDGERVPRNVLGLAGAIVRVVQCEDLAAAVSTIETLPERATLEDVHAHDDVLQRIVNAGVTVAAARFRQALSDDSEVCGHLRGTGARIQRLLAEFAGCAEMRLLIQDTSPLRDERSAPVFTSRASPGRAYLEQLRPLYETHLSLAAALGPVVRAERVSVLPNDGGAVFAHLVEHARVDDYRATVDAAPGLQGSHVVGPLALYSFSEPDL